MIDVLSDIPSFLQHVAHANTPTGCGLPKRPDKETLQKRLLERLQILHELREAWHIKYSTPVWPVPVGSSFSQGSNNVRPPFDASLYFTDLLRAYEYCTFQIDCILLFLLYQDISPDNLQPVEDILPGLFPNGSVQDRVRDVCRCTEFLCSEQNGSRGYILLQLPATIAYISVDKNTPEAKWLYDVCKTRARSSGFGWGDFAMDQVTPLSVWMASCRDRHRNRERSGRFSEGRPCTERAIASVNASSEHDAALPMRTGRRPDEAVSHPP